MCCKQFAVFYPTGLDRHIADIYRNIGYAGTYELVIDGDSFSYKPGVNITMNWTVFHESFRFLCTLGGLFCFLFCTVFDFVQISDYDIVIFIWVNFLQKR